MTTQQSYWHVHCSFFDRLAVGILAYGVNVHDDECYPWDAYLIDTLVLTYA